MMLPSSGHWMLQEPVNNGCIKLTYKSKNTENKFGFYCSSIIIQKRRRKIQLYIYLNNLYLLLFTHLITITYQFYLNNFCDLDFKTSSDFLENSNWTLFKMGKTWAHDWWMDSTKCCWDFNLMLTVSYSGGSVMLWASFLFNGRLQHGFTTGKKNIWSIMCLLSL